jgi:hypothetical protein
MKKKRILSLLITVAMVLSMMPTLAVNVGANPVSIPVELVVTTQDWDTVRSAPVTITANGPQTITLAVPAGRTGIIQMGVLSAGATFSAAPTGGTAITGLGDATVTFNTVTINTVTATPAAANASAPLIAGGTGNALAGFVGVNLWNAFHTADNRLTGGERANLTHGTAPDTQTIENGIWQADAAGAPITTITVAFTVAGIPTGSTTPNPGGSTVWNIGAAPHGEGVVIVPTPAGHDGDNARSTILALPLSVPNAPNATDVATITVNLSEAVSGNRAITLWTNLSEGTNVGDIRFAGTRLRFGEGTSATIPAGNSSIEVPHGILHNGTTGATTLYLALTLSNVAEGRYAEINRIATVTLSIAAACTNPNCCDLCCTNATGSCTHTCTCCFVCLQTPCVCCAVCGVHPCACPAGLCTHCGVGGRITHPHTIPTRGGEPATHGTVTNGNFVQGDGRTALRLDILRLIEGTNITPDMIYGIEFPMARAGNGEHRLEIQVRTGVDEATGFSALQQRSPLWVRRGDIQPGEFVLPQVTGTAQVLPDGRGNPYLIRYMNIFAVPSALPVTNSSNQEFATTITPFVTDNDTENFQIEIQPLHDTNRFRVDSVRLLGRGTGTKCAENNCWSGPSRVLVECTTEGCTSIGPTCTNTAHIRSYPLTYRCDGTCLQPVVLGEIRFVLPAAEANNFNGWVSAGGWTSFMSALPCTICTDCNACAAIAPHRRSICGGASATPPGSCNSPCCTDCNACTHETKEWFFATDAARPTCTAAGTETERCADCHHAGETPVTRPVEALGHLADEEGVWTVASEARCGVAGSETSPCVREGCTDGSATRALPALECEFLVWAPTRSQANCGEAITQTATCNRAGCELTGTQERPAGACGEEGCPKCGEGQPASKDALIAAITTANGIVTNTTASADGAGLADGTYWAPQAAIDAYSSAIAAAIVVRDNADATAAEIAAALQALAVATTTFNAARTRVGGAQPVDRAALQTALTNATNAVSGTTVSADGAGLAAGTWWATQDVVTTFQQAVDAAQAVFDNADATDAEIAAAVTALNQALGAFNGARTQVPGGTVTCTGNPATCQVPNCTACSTPPECTPDNPCGDCANCNDTQPCTCRNCETCGRLGGRFGLGNVRGRMNTDGTPAAPDVSDALQILRHLVGLSSVFGTVALDPTAPAGTTAADAIIAGNITRGGQDLGTPARLHVNDALAILRKLVGLSNAIDTPLIPRPAA